MADLTDVGSALVALIAQTVYPNGTGQASVANTGVRIYQGWPNPQQLDADLKLGICHVSVYPRTEERNVTRYSKDWQQLSVNTPTLTLTISGQTVTVGGTVPPANNPQNVTVLANRQPYIYAVQVADTLTSIATALATLIVAGIPVRRQRGGGHYAAGHCQNQRSSGGRDWHQHPRDSAAGAVVPDFGLGRHAGAQGRHRTGH
ncbi:hypothetical protein ACFQAT_10455 [Undibacterium arcticum]|uniref:hypothetical protein n=1 Tax=Undibacterium arcticum TaxID=1762892 RepID=UPI003618C7C2